MTHFRSSVILLLPLFPDLTQALQLKVKPDELQFYGTKPLSGMMRSCMFFSHVTTRYTLTYNQVNSISIYKKRRVPLVEQELPTIPEHLSSPRYSVGFVLLDLQFYVYVLQIVVCPFVLSLLIIVLSVLLRYTDSDYPPIILNSACSLKQRSEQTTNTNFTVLDLARPGLEPTIYLTLAITTSMQFQGFKGTIWCSKIVDIKFSAHDTFLE